MEREETLLILQVLPVMFVDPYSLLRIRDFGEEYCVCRGQTNLHCLIFFFFTGKSELTCTQCSLLSYMWVFYITLGFR